MWISGTLHTGGCEGSLLAPIHLCVYGPHQLLTPFLHSCPRRPSPTLQVAGLRKGFTWQDTQWGLFMSRYIFPGADASTPLYWYVKQLELAGFEVHSVENVGRHYSHTLHAWYDNWMKNQDTPQMKGYPDRLKRLWEIFLAWSTVAAGIGCATCYQIVAHKNTYTFEREKFCTHELAKRRQKML